jgi:hypothetical protein
MSHAQNICLLSCSIVPHTRIKFLQLRAGEIDRTVEQITARASKIGKKDILLSKATPISGEFVKTKFFGPRCGMHGGRRLIT